MTRSEPIPPGAFYHLYSRGNNRETLFRTPENYRFFLQRYAQHVEPAAATFAYCLLPNHFHLLVYVYTPEEQRAYHEQTCQVSKTWQVLTPSKASSNLFNAYTKAINKRYPRTGSLFEKPFKRKPVQNHAYFTTLVAYIHRNPQHHGLVDDFRDWPWSSYRALLSERPTRVRRETVLEWFGGMGEFVDVHGRPADDGLPAGLVEEDW